MQVSKGAKIQSTSASSVSEALTVFSWSSEGYI